MHQLLKAIYGAKSWTPVDIFGPMDEGFWFDLGDLEYLYQDADALNPVTEGGQDIRLVEDKLGGLHKMQRSSGATIRFRDGVPVGILGGDFYSNSSQIAIVPSPGFLGDAVFSNSRGNFLVEIDVSGTDWLMPVSSQAPSIGSFLGIDRGLAQEEVENLFNWMVSNNRAGTAATPLARFAFAGIRPLTKVKSQFNFAQGADAAWLFDDCRNLVEVPESWNWASVNSLAEGFQNCQALTSFPSVDLSNVVNLFRAWRFCTGLQSFPALNLGSANSVANAWNGCSAISEFPAINFPSLNTALDAWRNCVSMTTFGMCTFGATHTFTSAWRGCSSLVDFPALNMSNASAVSAAWQGCSSLVTFPEVLFGAINTNFSSAWNGCTSLVNFPANMFDDSLSVQYGNAFTGCALDQTSVDNILVSIDTSATNNLLDNGVLNISGGTNAAPSATGLSAVSSLQARGWTVTHN